MEHTTFVVCQHFSYVPNIGPNRRLCPILDPNAPIRALQRLGVLVRRSPLLSTLTSNKAVRQLVTSDLRDLLCPNTRELNALFNRSAKRSVKRQAINRTASTSATIQLAVSPSSCSYTRKAYQNPDLIGDRADNSQQTSSGRAVDEQQTSST